MVGQNKKAHKNIKKPNNIGFSKSDVSPIIPVLNSDFFQKLIENSSEVICILDEDYNSKYISPSSKEILGYLSDELLGRKCFEHIHPGSLKKLQLIFEEYKNKYNSKKQVAYKYMHKNGKWIYLCSTIQNFINDPLIKGFIVNTSDITQSVKSQTKLKNKEKSYKYLFSHNPQSMYIFDTDTLDFLDVNEAALKLYGYSKDEFLNLKLTDLFKEEDEDNVIKRAKRRDKSYYYSGIYTQIKKDKEKIIVKAKVHVMKFNSRDAKMILIEDITDNIEIERKMNFQANLLNTIRDAVIAVNLEGNIIFVNDFTQNLYGWSREELIGEPISKIILDMNTKGLISEILNNFESEKFIGKEFLVRNKKGKEFTVSVNTSPIYDQNKNIIGIVGVSIDITERKKDIEKIRNSLLEKEVLLNEVHHRVKNNLQVISSILNLQSKFVKDKYSKSLFKDAQTRIKSMAIVHEKLYKEKKFFEINFSEYVKSVISYLENIYKSSKPDIKIIYDIDENIFFDSNKAVSLGLILNELVTNAYKYAFPKGHGKIIISLAKENDKYRLSVNDNGIGIAENIDIRNTESLGMQLVCLLTDQLYGSLNLDKKNGTKFDIIFP